MSRRAPRVRRYGPKPRLSYAARHPQRKQLGRRWWIIPSIAIVGVAVIALVALNLWLQWRPPGPDDAAVHADILAGRSGAEVTLNATVLQPAAQVGTHEHIEVSDPAGDQLELDYNLDLGRWVPVTTGEHMVVHGQLYIDPGRAGVHCLHAQTSRGCPYPGFIQAGGQTYS